MTTEIQVQDARESILDKGYFEYWKLGVTIFIAVTLANLLAACLIAAYASFKLRSAIDDVVVPSDDPSNSKYLDCVLSTEDITSCDSLLK